MVNESDLNACCFEISDAFGRAGSVGPSYTQILHWFRGFLLTCGCRILSAALLWSAVAAGYNWILFWFGFVRGEEGGDYRFFFFRVFFFWVDECVFFSGGDLLWGCASRGRIWLDLFVITVCLSVCRDKLLKWNNTRKEKETISYIKYINEWISRYVSFTTKIDNQLTDCLGEIIYVVRLQS